MQNLASWEALNCVERPVSKSNGGPIRLIGTQGLRHLEGKETATSASCLERNRGSVLLRSLTGFAEKRNCSVETGIVSGDGEKA
jgi:hypothetical protein